MPARPILGSLLVLFPALVAAAPSALAADGVLAIRAKRVHAGTGGEPVAAVILVRDGKIEAVGPAVAIPADATVIDGGESGVVIPGLVDAGAGYGLSGEGNEQSSEVTPDFRAADSIDPNERLFAQAAQAGVTTAYVGPGGSNVVGGLGAVVKTAGSPRVLDRLVTDRAALEATIGVEPSRGNNAPRGGAPNSFFSRRPTTRMGIVWLLRRSFTDVVRSAPGTVMEPPVTAGGRAVLEDVIAGRLPIRVSARQSHDILSAFRLADELSWPRVIVEEASEAYQVQDEFARRKASVVLGPFGFEPRSNGQRLDNPDEIWSNAAVLAARGIGIAFQTGVASDGPRLRDLAAFSVRHGLAPDAALRAVTLGAAEVLGVASRVGSLEPGKDADLVLLSGDALDPRSVVECVVIGGRVVYRRTESF